MPGTAVNTLYKNKISCVSFRFKPNCPKIIIPIGIQRYQTFAATATMVSTVYLVIRVYLVPTRAGRRQMVWPWVLVSALSQRRDDSLLWRHLEYDFLACLLLCLAFYFSFFVFLVFLLRVFFFPASRYVYLLRVPPVVCAVAICYSQQVRIL